MSMKITLELIASSLKVSRQAAADRANRENWPFALEPVRGGQRKVFALDDLPPKVRRDIFQHQKEDARRSNSKQVQNMIDGLRAADAAKKTGLQARGEANLCALMQPLLPTVQARLDGRFEIVRAWEDWFKTSTIKGKKKAYGAFVDAFNRGETTVCATVHTKFNPLSRRTLERWVAKMERDGMAGLIDKLDGSWCRDVNVITKNPHLEKVTIGLMISRPGIKMMAMTDMLRQAAVDCATGEVLFEAPSYWAVTRFCNAWKEKNAELFTAATNPDEWKNKYMVAFGDADEHIVRLNQQWQMDATPADWMLTDDDGGTRRYSASVVIDVYSRRALIVLSPTPRAETHKLALRLAILAWGVPEEVVTDNGKDYLSKGFLSVLKQLCIEHFRTNPFSPWEKPFVERMNETILHSILEVYSSFIGHNVADRKAIEARASFAERLFDKDAKLIEMAMPAPLLQERLNQWLAGTYEQREHSELGMSPFVKAAEYSGEIKRIQDERALDVLLSPPAGKGTYTITKKGLRIQKAQFIALELARFVGKSVQVYLTDDFGHVVVYHEGEFVCVARCPERTGVSRQEIASHARKMQRKHITAQRQAAKVPNLDPDALVTSLLRERAEAAGRLVALPSPSSDYHTPALIAAGQAARTLDGAVATSDIPADLRMTMEKMKAAESAPATPTNVSFIPETAQLRFRKWLELDELLNQGGTIEEPRLIKWYGMYPQSGEHASMYKRHQEAIRAASGANTAATVRAINN